VHAHRSFGADGHSGRSIRAGAPVIVEDIANDLEFRYADGLRQHGIDVAHAGLVKGRSDVAAARFDRSTINCCASRTREITSRLRCDGLRQNESFGTILNR